MARAALVRVAARQFGVASRAQVLAAGLSPDSIDRALAGGQWSRPHPGVYSLWTPSDGDLFYRDLFAATLWMGPQSATSHRAATVVWGLDVLRGSPREVTTTSRHRCQDVIVHRVESFESGDIKVLGGLRVTSIERTLIDLGSVVPRAVVARTVLSALRNRLTHPKRIQERIDRGGLRSGVAIMRAILADALPPTESEFESLMWQFFQQSGLPLPECQYVIRDPQGKVVARADFAYPEARLIIEADGLRFHSTPADLQRDGVRQNKLLELHWRVYRLSWLDLKYRKKEVVAEISKLLSQ